MMLILHKTDKNTNYKLVPIGKDMVVYLYISKKRKECNKNGIINWKKTKIWNSM